MNLPVVLIKKLIGSLPRGVRLQITILLIIVLILFTIFLQTDRSEPEKSDTGSALGTRIPQLYKVVDVVDGDTIKVEQSGERFTVRLIGIDAPELNGGADSECFAREASTALEQKVLGKYVALQDDKTQANKDRYGRLLRYVFLDDENVNGYMIEGGFAKEYKYAKKYEFYDEFVLKQNSARMSYRGLWSPSACASN